MENLVEEIQSSSTLTFSSISVHFFLFFFSVLFFHSSPCFTSLTLSFSLISSFSPHFFISCFCIPAVISMPLTSYFASICFSFVGFFEVSTSFIVLSFFYPNTLLTNQHEKNAARFKPMMFSFSVSRSHVIDE